MAKVDRAIFEIDENDLVGEIRRQPGLRFDWGVKLADARKEVEEKKAERDLCYAKLDKAIRKTPAQFGFDPSAKPTEKLVEATIARNSEYLSICQDLLDLEHSVAVISAAVTSLDHKKRGLTDLVELHGQQYFAAVPVTEQGGKALEKKGTTMSKRRRKELEDFDEEDAS